MPTSLPIRVFSSYRHNSGLDLKFSFRSVHKFALKKNEVDQMNVLLIRPTVATPELLTFQGIQKTKENVNRR